jgi:hypothetical protein
MSNLLAVTKLQSEVLQNKATMPIMVEIPVSPETAPYLVSSSSAMLWIEKPHPGDKIKAAVRWEVPPAKLFNEVLEAVIKKSGEENWGNVHPFTVDGLVHAIDYVKSYDLNDLEILVSKKHPSWFPEKFIVKEEIPIRLANWLPKDCAVVVPKEKDLVGLIGHLNTKAVIVVVHNACRCFGIVKGV